VDHRVAFHSQRIHSIRLDSAQQETRHRYALFIVDDFKRCTGCDSSEQFYFTERIAALVFNFNVECKRTVFMFPDQQTPTLEGSNMLCNSRTRLHSKLSGDLRVRRDVAVAFEEPSD